MRLDYADEPIDGDGVLLIDADWLLRIGAKKPANDHSTEWLLGRGFPLYSEPKLFLEIHPDGFARLSISEDQQAKGWVKAYYPLFLPTRQHVRDICRALGIETKETPCSPA